MDARLKPAHDEKIWSLRGGQRPTKQSLIPQQTSRLLRCARNDRFRGSSPRMTRVSHLLRLAIFPRALGNDPLEPLRR
jgi:hypothetical protein